MTTVTIRSAPRACCAGTPYARVARDGEAEVRLLAVAPAARGRGIGTHLTMQAVSLARSRGRRRVALNSGPDMVAAHRRYEHLGFERLPARETRLADGRPLYAFGLDLADGVSHPLDG